MLVTRKQAIHEFVNAMCPAELYSIIRADEHFKAHWWYPQSAVDKLMPGYTPKEVIGCLAPDFDATMLFVRINDKGYLESDCFQKREQDMDNLRPELADYLAHKTVGKTGWAELDELINSSDDTAFNMVFNK